MTTFNINQVRADFPILSESVYGKPLVYLDNGATTQKPLAVIDALDEYYKTINSNVHRGVHLLSQLATDAHELARRRVQQFINAQHDYEIIFTKGTTESINLVAYAYCKKFVQPGDDIIITEMEHHSNIVPWQMACEARGANLKVVPINDEGALDMEAYKKMLSGKTKMVAVTWASNTLGTINPIKEIIDLAHQYDAPVLVDAAQSIQHIATDVQEMDIDFLVFSGHKIYGPTGIGVLYGKEKWLNAMPPYQGGGSMIKSVTFSKTTYADLPFKFEAGTPDIAGTIGLGAALQYIGDIGLAEILKYEDDLLLYATEQLEAVKGLKIIGTAPDKTAVISFLIDGLHPFDVGELLDKQGIAVRTGHHCCQPIMDKYHIPGTIRASFCFYNTKEEIDALTAGLGKAISMLS